MEILAAMAFGLALSSPSTRDADVRAAIVNMQQSGNPGWTGPELVPLDKSAAPALVRLLPKIEVPWVFEAVASELQMWGYKASIPALMKSLDRPLWAGRDHHHASEPALGKWGWPARNALLRGAVEGSYQKRLICVRVLAGGCRGRPEDARLTKLFLRTSRSPSTDFRRASTSALNRLSGRILGWMEMHHPATMDNPATFERLMEMSFDRDADVAHAAALDVHTWLWSHAQGTLKDYNFTDYNRVVTPEELPGLKGLCSTGASPFERAAALALLRYGRKAGPEHVAALADGAALVRRIAAECLLDQVAPEMLPSLAEVAGGPAEANRLAAADVLAHTYFVASLDILRPLLKDRSKAVRRAAQAGIDRIEGRNLN